MSIDIFGRQLVSNNSGRSVIRGPPGVGFKFTVDKQYDLNGKRLCNIANPQELNDAVSLKSFEDITWRALGVLEHSMEKSFANSTLQALHKFESQLNAHLDREHTNNFNGNQHIQTLMGEEINALTVKKEVLEIRLTAIESNLEAFSHNGILRGSRVELD